jgi:hypothetical protein
VINSLETEVLVAQVFSPLGMNGLIRAVRYVTEWGVWKLNCSSKRKQCAFGGPVMNTHKNEFQQSYVH